MVEQGLKDVITDLNVFLVPTVSNGYGLLIDTSETNSSEVEKLNPYYGMSFSATTNELIEQWFNEHQYEKDLIKNRYFLQDYIDTSSYDAYRMAE